MRQLEALELKVFWVERMVFEMISQDIELIRDLFMASDIYLYLSRAVLMVATKNRFMRQRNF